MLDKEQALYLAREQMRFFDDLIHIANRQNDTSSAKIFRARKKGYLYCLRDLGLIDDLSYELEVIDHVSVEPEGGEENEQA